MGTVDLVGDLALTGRMRLQCWVLFLEGGQEADGCFGFWILVGRFGFWIRTGAGSVFCGVLGAVQPSAQQGELLHHLLHPPLVHALPERGEERERGVNAGEARRDHV